MILELNINSSPALNTLCYIFTIYILIINLEYISNQIIPFILFLSQNPEIDAKLLNCKLYEIHSA